MTQSNLSEAPRKRRRWRTIVLRVVLILLIGIVASLAGMYAYYTRPHRLRALAEDFLQQFARGALSIGSASFSWWDGLRLSDIRITDDYKAQSGRTAFECHELHVNHNPWPLLLGQYVVESVAVDQPTFQIVRRVADGETDVAGLRPLTSLSGDRPTLSAAIELRNASFKVVSVGDTGNRVVDTLDITVRARPVTPDSGVYEVVWRGGSESASSGQAHIDFRNGTLRNIRGGLPWVSLEAVLIAVNSKYDAAGTWSDLLGIKGRVRVRDYFFSWSGSEDRPFAIIDLERAALSVPVDPEENSLSPNERYLRFKNVEGTVHVMPDSVRMQFGGMFHEASCEVNATMRSAAGPLTSLDDVDFDVRANFRNLRIPRPAPDGLPDEQRFLDRWTQLAGVYRDFDPDGPIDVEIALAKAAGATGAVTLHRAIITARGCNVSYRFFPYRIEDMTGTVEYTGLGLSVSGLCGMHGDATICAEGWLSEPSRCGAGLLEIKGVGVDIESDLLRALPDEFHPAYQTFCPEGNVDAHVTMVRDWCHDDIPQPWHFNTAIDLNLDRVTYRGFPIPIENVTGKVNVFGGEVGLSDIRGVNDEASVFAFGSAHVSDGDLEHLSLRLDLDDLHAGTELVRAIPEPFRQSIERFALQGPLDAQAILRVDSADAPIDVDVAVELGGISAKYVDVPSAVEGISGGIRFLGDRISLHRVRGRHDKTEIEINGLIDTVDPRKTTIRVHADNAVIDEQLVRRFAESSGSATADWSLSGPVTLDAELTVAPESRSGFDASCALQFSGATFRHAAFPVEIADIQGLMHVGGHSIVGDISSARIAGGKAAFQFQIDRPGDQETAIITGTAYSLLLRDLLKLRTGSRAPSDLFSGLTKSDTRADFRRFQLEYHRGADQPKGRWKTSGLAEIHLLTLESFGAIGQVAASFDGVLRDFDGHSHLTGTVSVPRCDPYGIPVTNVRGDWRLDRDSDSTAFTIDKISAQSCDGDLSALFGLTYEKDIPEYHASMLMRDLDLKPLAMAFGAIEQKAGLTTSAEDISGRLQGQFSMTGILGDVQSRKGEGRLQVRDGRIYRMPFIWAVLQVINLNMPSDDLLGEGAVAFLLEGNRVVIDDLQLTGKNIDLIGSGTMTLPDHGVNLRLLNVSPSLWDKVPLIGAVREEVYKDLIEIQVTGPISRPNVRAVPLRGVSSELEQLFQKRKPRKK